MKKKVLIFSTAYFPHIGGAEVAVHEICKRVNDFEFVLVTAKIKPGLLDVEKIGNVTVHRLGKGSSFDKLLLIFKGPRYAKKLGNFDIVWSIMASYAGFASLFFKNKNPKVKYLLTLQEGDSFSHIYSKVWFVWPLFKNIFKKADCVQAISNYLKNWAIKMGAKSNVKVIPNGVNMKSDIIIQHKYCSHNKLITVSRLVEKNGVEDLINAMTFLDENIHLTIIGDGYLREGLEKLAKKRKLDNRVHFAGAVPPDKIYSYLKNSDVFCRPSLSEGLGNAFLEAMLAEVPVIGTMVGGIPDFLEDEVTGWACQVNNPSSIAEKVRYIISKNNKKEVDEVVARAKKMVEEKYNWDLIAKDMASLLSDL